MPEFNRILITGAAGSLGTHLRKGLAHLATTVRLADRMPMGDAAPHEEIMTGDLSDMEFTRKATAGCDVILHFAGTPREQTFQEIITDTLPASYAIWESARQNRVRRVVYASSIHAVGYHAVEDVPGINVPHRPDSFYGMTKCFTEDLARLYWDKFGLESVCLRICSCFPEPADRRMLWSWLSFADCVRLTEAAMTAPRTGFSVIYGTSDNAETAVSNNGASHIGYVPCDSADRFRARVMSEKPRPDPTAPAVRFVGGWFTGLGHPDDAAG
jgi:uronate dehydrogenase